MSPAADAAVFSIGMLVLLIAVFVEHTEGAILGATLVFMGLRRR